MNQVAFLTCIHEHEMCLSLANANLLSNQIGLTASLQCLDVGPARVLSEHLDINQPHKQFLQPSLVHLGIFQSRLQDLDLSAYQSILFCFRLALSDCSDERIKLPTPGRSFLAQARGYRVHGEQYRSSKSCVLLLQLE